MRKPVVQVIMNKYLVSIRPRLAAPIGTFFTSLFSFLTTGRGVAADSGSIMNVTGLAIRSGGATGLPKYGISVISPNFVYCASNKVERCCGLPGPVVP